MENDTYESDFDSADFDSTEPTESVAERQGDATDAIAEMLISGSTDAIDNFDGDSGDAFKMGHVRDGDSTVREPKEDNEWRAGADNNPSAPDMESVQGRFNHYTDVERHTQQKWQQLEEMRADMTPEQYEWSKQYLQGQYAASQIGKLQAEKEALQNNAWWQGEMQKVINAHSEIWHDEGKRHHYQKEIISFLGNDMGFSADEMRGMDARMMNACINHIKQRDELAMAKLELAKLKQERKAHQGHLRQSRRDSEVGAKGTKSTEAQQDEIMKVLFGGGR